MHTFFRIIFNSKQDRKTLFERYEKIFKQINIYFQRQYQFKKNYFNIQTQGSGATIMIQKSTSSKENWQQYWDHSTQLMMTANQIYTNVNQNDDDRNGQTLTLNIDRTFNLGSKNYSWDSHDHFTWSSFFSIDGIWSFDKEIKTITLTATKFGASLQQPLKNQQQKIGKGFPNRVISTSNFDCQSSKDIKSFIVVWDYDKFVGVKQGTLKRK